MSIFFVKSQPVAPDWVKQHVHSDLSALEFILKSFVGWLNIIYHVGIVRTDQQRNYRQSQVIVIKMTLSKPP